jgi:hypothetical protein
MKNGFDLSATDLVAIHMVEQVVEKVYGKGATLKVARGRREPITDDTLIHAVTIEGCIVYDGGQTPFTCVCSLESCELRN